MDIQLYTLDNKKIKKTKEIDNLVINVRLTAVNKSLVQTTFIGIAKLNEKKPFLFNTKVFGSEMKGATAQTYVQAMRNHKSLVNELKKLNKA